LARLVCWLNSRLETLRIGMERLLSM
jgi:hypothetical protein